MMERRQQPRTTIQYPVYFICMGADGRETVQDIAVATDISAGGMQIETATPINTMSIKILASTKNKERLEIDGGIIYSMQAEGGKFRTGIFFQGSPEEMHRFVEQIMLAYDEGR